MKKIALCLIFIFTLTCIYTSAFAATQILLTKVEIGDTGVISVEGKIKEPSNFQRYTAVVLKYKESGEYTIADAVYIGQKEKEDVILADGFFSFDFKGNTDNGEKYLVRIGGSNISAIKDSDHLGGEFEGDDDNDDKISEILGDVNGDFKIDTNDASVLLRFVLNKNGVLDEEIKGKEKFLERSNVTGDEELTAVQVGYILKRALEGEGFLFPIQNQNQK